MPGTLASGYAPPGGTPGFSAPAQPAPGYGSPGVGFPAGRRAPAPPQRDMTVWCLVACGIVLAGLLGGIVILVLGHTGDRAANGLPTATATPAVPQGFKLFTSQVRFFRMAYPARWQVTSDEQNAYDAFGDPPQFAYLQGFVPKPGVTATEADDNVCGRDGAANGKTRPKLVTIAGQTWTEEECVDSSFYKNKVEAIIYHGHLFALSFYCPEPTFDSNQQQYFSVMEQTFQFLL